MFVDMVCVTKIIHPEGHMGFSINMSDNMSETDALALLIPTCDKLRKQILDNWED